MTNYKIGQTFEQKNYEEMASCQVAGDGFIFTTNQITVSYCPTLTIPHIPTITTPKLTIQ
ncbi:hypothetical protein [Clostridium cellulovorans]|uniref:Uncharacterized protein n=1 Tax=Clostridium cellulovorans (strain ATCC 35296 / DSM 3052 / OCM 3 / 743B) TaxID=573061 RepID=D9ST31_CLOC7|nr:hypothetical protein [Clostridium cellulovorans]ADL50647.1 hypothetical protein Clocel_0877 [Clostridium cellulovorans 743B]